MRWGCSEGRHHDHWRQNLAFVILICYWWCYTAINQLDWCDSCLPIKMMKLDIIGQRVNNRCLVCFETFITWSLVKTKQLLNYFQKLLWMEFQNVQFKRFSYHSDFFKLIFRQTKSMTFFKKCVIWFGALTI